MTTITITMKTKNDIPLRGRAGSPKRLITMLAVSEFSNFELREAR